jgi:hypothetical protein
MIYLGNICINTLHKGAKNDDDDNDNDDDDDDDDNNNNNNDTPLSHFPSHNRSHSLSTLYNHQTTHLPLLLS